MGRNARFASVLFLSSVLVCAGCGRPETSEPRPPQSAGSVDAANVEGELESAIPGLLEQARIAGLSLCLIRDNRLVWCDGFGVTGADPATPVGTTTVFQAASLSKPVFAYTVLRLAD
jgi:CubicO group peptidase (beta-lactamase class C family)